jgi:hypothetical protein
MPAPSTLVFESELSIARKDLWARITDLHGVREEMMPILAMTSPKGVRTLSDIPFAPGRRLFRSVLLLGGFLPVDYSDLTLIELVEGRRFVEASPMLSMKLWRHTREILAHPQKPALHILRDTLEFVPRLPAFIAVPAVRFFFRHRHAVLRRSYNAA